MKIGFVHFSDLFFPSGSAVLYRRILAEVSREHDVFHVIGLHRSGQSPSEITAVYRRELPRVEPVFLSLNNALRVYYRLRGTAPFSRWPSLPGRFFRAGMRQILDRQAPDFLWWSCDYLPESLSTLWEMRAHLPGRARLHLSLMDPPELWPDPRKCLALYKHCLPLARSFDCIGDHLRDRLRDEADDKPVFIINDFIEQTAEAAVGARETGSPLRAAISGHIYSPVELQQFLLALGQAAAQAELLWFGQQFSYEGLRGLQVPANVRVHCPGPLPRDKIIAALQPCDFAYLSMPAALPAFARYSVPTKLVTYVEAGLPVAFHAPADSEVQGLNQTYRFGVNLALSPVPADDLRHLFATRSLFVAGLRSLGRDRYAKEHVMAVVRDFLACAGNPGSHDHE